MNSCNNCKRESAAPGAGTVDGSCPMRMADGRNFTDYHTRCGQLEQLRALNGIQSSYDLRMFMQQNADKLMTENRMASIQDNSCSPCYINNGNGTMLPEESLVQCDERLCRIVPNPRNVSNDGLGQGRQSGPAPSSASSMVYYPIEGISQGGHDRWGAPM